MKYLLIFYSICLICLQFCCTTEPEELNLTINNGYFEKLNNSEPDFEYAVEFEYKVTGNICYVGGYGIQWNDDRHGYVDWYVMQKLEPGRTYSINDTFRVSADIAGNPLVQMQGYLEGDTESDSRLKAIYNLKNK